MDWLRASVGKPILLTANKAERRGQKATHGEQETALAAGISTLCHSLVRCCHRPALS